jgi:hypothetical protein
VTKKVGDSVADKMRNGSLLNELMPVTAKDALAKWDSGRTVFTIELGGLGPGYEQCIHILVFELIRDYSEGDLPTFGDLENPTPTEQKRWSDWGDAAVSRCALRFSGAQVSVAKGLAYRALRDGWRKTIDSAPKDRHIQVSREFPQPPAVVA